MLVKVDEREKDMFGSISGYNITKFGKNVQKKQTKDSEALAGSKSQGAAHANEKSAVVKRTTDIANSATANIVAFTAENNAVISPVVFKEQVAAINEAIAEPTASTSLNSAAIAASIANMDEESVQELQEKVSNDLIQSQAQRAEQSRKNSVLNRETSPDLQAVMEKNGIISTGNLKDDINAIKATVAGLDKEAAKALRDEFKSMGVGMDAPAKEKLTKESFRDLNQWAAINKQLLVNKKTV